MHLQPSGFSFQVFVSSNELSNEDAHLLAIARDVTKQAYAPYSSFFVGVAAQMMDGKIITGTNQENASFPVGICAEQVTLSAISSQYAGLGIIHTMAISYQGTRVKSDHPISPCGVCRQALTEHETRSGQPIRLILAGLSGEVYVISSAQDLLPLPFKPHELGN